MSGVPKEKEDLVFYKWRDFSNQVYELFKPSDQWIFRGQSKSSWPLASKLERELDRYGKDQRSIRNAEANIVREFLRKYKNYLGSEHIQDAMEALSYIQHYGGATRYLDWSYSIYIAAYFAIKGAVVNDWATVWCFRSTFWSNMSNREKYAGKVFGCNPTTRNSELQELFGIPVFDENGGCRPRESELYPCVFQVAPCAQNLNIERQQGLFLMTSQPEKGFENNLSEMIGKSEDKKDFIRRIDICCDDQFLTDALTDLRRMSVSSEVLFGGAGGLCEALNLGIMNLYNLQSGATGLKI